MQAQQQAMIEQYVKAYNNFDVVGMIQDLHHDVIFENISDNEVTLEIQGLEAFQKQAEMARHFFSSRRQQISNWHFSQQLITIDIEYRATLATDFPNGMKKGDSLHLNGQSCFQFKDDKIIRITDKS